MTAGALAGSQVQVPREIIFPLQGFFLEGIFQVFYIQPSFSPLYLLFGSTVATRGV